MSYDKIFCFNNLECIYTNCPQFCKQLDTCNFIIIGLLKDGQPTKSRSTTSTRDTTPTPTNTNADVRTISNLRAGDQSSKGNNINIQGDIVYDPQEREINNRDGNTTKVADIVLDDGTGKIRISFWGKHAKTAMSFHKGDEVLIENVYQIKPSYEGVLQANAGNYFKISKI